MANILYLSCHAILEANETKLFTEMGHNVFSFGSYINSMKPHDNKRPGYKGYYNDHLVSVAIQCSQDNLHQELIDFADVIIVMHRSDWITKNWEKIKHKRVIWRSIGQSQPDVESDLYIPRAQGLRIVRYSPEEKNIPNYAGEDKMIRFYIDEKEFKNWNGKDKKVLTVAQSMKQRGLFCGFDIFNQVTEGLPRVLYGPENDVSGIEGGLLTYTELKKAYRDNAVYFYTGTYPASYTLNFMEALMSGIPVVARGEGLFNINIWPMHTYEVHKILNGTNGFCSDNIDELREKVKFLLENPLEAKKMGEEGRKTAIELFGKQTIINQWKEFLENN